ARRLLSRINMAWPPSLTLSPRTEGGNVQFAGLSVLSNTARVQRSGTDQRFDRSLPLFLGRGSGRGANNSSSLLAPFLSSGILLLPHLGDCTHDGQPSAHGQSAMISWVARSSSSSVA